MKRGIVFILILSITSALGANPMKNTKQITYYTTEDIEVPFVLEQSDNLPIIQLDIIFKNAGSLKDSIPGLANFTSDMLEEGTKNKPFGLFHEELEQRAISLSAHNGRETFVFSLSCLLEEFNSGAKLLQELLNEPNLTQPAYEKVATQIKSSILEKEQDFDSVASKQLSAAIFAKTPFEYPKIGTLTSIEKITLKDISTFLKDNLTLNNATVVLGGKFDEKQIKTIQKILKTLPKKDTTPITKYAMVTKPISKTVYKDTEQAYIYFASPYHIDVNAPDIHKAKVAMFVLGSSGFGSRLMEEIRVKKGLAYSIYASLDVEKSRSLMSGYMQTKIENEKEAIQIIKDEIAQFIDKGVSEQELSSAKKFIVGSEPLRNETMSQRLSFAFNEFYKELGEDSQKKFLHNVENLTLKELNSFVKEHKEILELSFSIVTAKK